MWGRYFIKDFQKEAKDITKLLLPYKPTEIIKDLADYKNNNPKFGIEKVHFFLLAESNKQVIS